MNFIEKIVGAIIDPDNETKKIAEQPMIEEAVFIVGIYAVLVAIAAYIQSYKITFGIEGLDNIPSSMQSLMTISIIVFALIGPFLMWLIGSGVIHLLSIAAGGEGKFYPQMMTVAGYSMLPLILAGIISIGLFSVVEPQTIIISPANPMAVNMYSTPPFIISEIAGILFQAWSTIILFFCIRNVHKLSSDTSAIIASIPLALSMISLIFSFRGIGLI
jgi:hypothetical protein